MGRRRRKQGKKVKVRRLRWRRDVWKEKDEREEEKGSCAGLRTCRPQKEKRGGGGSAWEGGKVGETGGIGEGRREGGRGGKEVELTMELKLVELRGRRGTSLV